VIRHVKILVVCVIVRWKVDKVGKWMGACVTNGHEKQKMYVSCLKKNEFKGLNLGTEICGKT